MEAKKAKSLHAFDHMNREVGGLGYNLPQAVVNLLPRVDMPDSQKERYAAHQKEYTKDFAESIELTKKQDEAAMPSGKRTTNSDTKVRVTMTLHNVNNINCSCLKANILLLVLKDMKSAEPIFTSCWTAQILLTEGKKDANMIENLFMRMLDVFPAGDTPHEVSRLRLHLVNAARVAAQRDPASGMEYNAIQYNTTQYNAI